MVRFATKFDTENPYSIPNPGPTPKIDLEEGLPPGGLDIAWVHPSRKNKYNWSEGLKWYERLHAHATLTSARRNFKCKRPFAPKDELDFVLDAVYDPLKDPFSEKQDVYLQMETAYGEDVNIRKHSTRFEGPSHRLGYSAVFTVRRPPPKRETWRLLRNRFVIYPDKPLPRGHPLSYSTTSGQRRENIYNVKLGIAADHSPQTNPGYSRTPCGAFFAV